jgi:uncharacterized integral membrane protein
MMILRLIIVGALLATIAAVCLHNTQLLPLVILGQKTISLPLWAWLLGALSLGALTNIFFTGLLQWTAYWTRRSERKAVGGGANPAWGRDRAGDEPPIGNRTSGPRPGPSAQPSAQPSAYQPPKPPKEVVDADFRVIQPPSRKLEDE